MKYLLALGLLGVVNADVYCSSNDRTTFNSNYCDGGSAPWLVSLVDEANGADLYYCAAPLNGCPTGWATGTTSQYNGNYCYLVVVPNLLDQTCKDLNGDFCPEGQSPLNGVCASDEGDAATDNSGSAASDPCTADPYDKDACCATKVLASEYIDAQCCNCN